MLEKTQEILNKFYQHNFELYKSAAMEFKPNASSYRAFDEMHDVYHAMFSLSQFIHDKVFRAKYDLQYITPKQVLKDIDRVKEDTDTEINKLTRYIKKYENLGGEVPKLILKTNKYYSELQETLNYILDLDEISEVRNRNEKRRLIDQNIQLQSQLKFDKELRKAHFYLAGYLILAIVIIGSIIYLNGTGKKYSVALTLLLIIPIIDSWINKERLPHFLRLTFSKKYKAKILKEIAENIELR